MTMKNPHAIWASVVVIVALTAGVTVLAAMEKDIAAIFSLVGMVAIPVLGAFGVTLYQKMDQVKDLSNGSTSRLLSMVTDLHSSVKELALRVPASVRNGDETAE